MMTVPKKKAEVNFTMESATSEVTQSLGGHARVTLNSIVALTLGSEGVQG